VGHGVARDRHAVVAHVGVQSAVEDALLGHLAGEHQMVDALLTEQVVERGGVEDAVARLDHEGRLVVGADRLDEVGPRSMARRFDQLLAGGGPVPVVVVDVDDLHSFVVGASDQVADVGHRALDARRELVRVLMLVGVEHVDDHQG